MVIGDTHLFASLHGGLANIAGAVEFTACAVEVFGSGKAREKDSDSSERELHGDD